MKKNIKDDSIIAFLNLELKRRKSVNPLYSLRAFSNYLGISPSSLSQVISGKRKLMGKVREKIISRLELDNKLSVSSSLSYQLLQIEEYALSSIWYFDAILELIKFDKFQANPCWISEKLRISKKDAEEALSILIKKKLIMRESRDVWLDNTSGHTSHITSEGTTIARKNYQKSLLDLSIRSLLNDDIRLRDHTSMMVSIKSEKVVEAKKLLRDFRREFAKLIDESKNPNQVYQLSLGFFPISKEI